MKDKLYQRTENPNNQKDVAVVKLWTTPFGFGIMLLDTPGVGSV